MFKFFIVLVGFVTFFSACPAEAADVTDAKEELPTLVMLSTPS